MGNVWWSDTHYVLGSHIKSSIHNLTTIGTNKITVMRECPYDIPRTVLQMKLLSVFTNNTI